MPGSPTDIDSARQGAGTAGQGGGLGLGERLRSARKARALSLERVSEALNLDESIILALEDERFDELGAPVFVRGHLKAYAKLIGLSEQTVLDSYGRAEPEALTIRTSERPVRRSVTVNPVIWGFSSLVVLLGLILTVYVMQDDDTDSLSVSLPASSPPPPEPALQPQLQAAQAAPESFPAEPVSPAPGIAEPPDRAAEPEPVQIASDPAPPERIEPAQSAAPAIEPAARPSAELVRLNLHFREESWVEISDANQRLLFGLQRKGRKREIAGEPPFRLLLGNARGVDVTVNDEPFAVPASNVTGKVARFEISAAAAE